MPRQEAREVAKLLFIRARERKKKQVSWGLSGACIVLTANAAKVQTSGWACYMASEKMSYEYIGWYQVRKWSPSSRPLSESEGAGLKAQAEGTNRDRPRVSFGNSSSHHQIICWRVSIKQKESKVLQWQQVEMKKYSDNSQQRSPGKLEKCVH